MSQYDWPVTFREVFDRGIASYRNGNRTPATFFDAADRKFLESIGCTSQELFDFVEDHVRGGDPSFEMVLLITAVRREYFLKVQNGKRSGQIIDMKSLPAKSSAVAGIEWLPRIIVKARAKLRGEMPDELMYGCGGDRPFLRSVNIEPSDFLRFVWSAPNDQAIIDYVVKSRG